MRSEVAGRTPGEPSPRLPVRIGALSAHVRPTRAFIEVMPKYEKPHEEFLYHVMEAKGIWDKLSPLEKAAIGGNATDVLNALVGK